MLLKKSGKDRSMIRRAFAEFGGGGLRSILESVLLKTMFDLPSMENVNEVIVDSGAAKGQSQPIIVHSKNAQKDKDKDKSKTSAA